MRVSVALLIFCLWCGTSCEGSPKIILDPSTIDEVFRMANEENAARSQQLPDGMIRDGYDMMLTEQQYRALYQPGMARAGNIIATPWTHGVIPIKIREGDFNDTQIEWIYSAMDHWMQVTCLHFRNATASDTNFVEIYKGSGCWAHLGMMGGEQKMNLDPYCFWKGTIEHEFGHTIGMIHEHQRPNRDGYIRVDYYAVGTTSIGSLTKYARGSDDKLGLPYDYTSVMHYGKTAFSMDSVTQTIYTRDLSMEDEIGMINGPSFIDAKFVNLMYKCQDQCDRQPRCNDGCFVTHDCKCFCREDMPHEYCTDKDSDCHDRAHNGECRSSSFITHTRCRKSCQICNDDGSPAHLPCFNANDQCEEWASSGECESNPSYMKRSCAPACGVCEEGWGSVPVQGPCLDKRTDCQKLAKEGECNRNAKLMLDKCRRSCEFCQEDMGVDPTNKTGCSDFDTVCQYQSEHDHCRRYYTGMLTECRQHCDLCDIPPNLPADCVDGNAACRNWAASGDCDSNPGYMHDVCKKSCNVCNGTVVPDKIANQCMDGDKRCPAWNSTGECSNNPVWMAKNCRKSCEVCQDTSSGGDSNNDNNNGNNNGCDNDNNNDNNNGGDNNNNNNDNNNAEQCTDEEDDCSHWAQSDQCYRNPGYMMWHCQKSCGVCDDNGCVDKNENCAGWAATEQCQGNPGYMLKNCPVSCGNCP